MPGDPKECREHAKRCWALASEVTNPASAQRWPRLATDLEAMHILLDEWRREDQIDDTKKTG
jgi:hypothetical protein